MEKQIITIADGVWFVDGYEEYEPTNDDRDAIKNDDVCFVDGTVIEGIDDVIVHVLGVGLFTATKLVRVDTRFPCIVNVPDGRFTHIIIKMWK